MGSFLRTNRQHRVIIEIPPAIPSDAQYEIRVTEEARERGNVCIYQDGHLAVLIERDGKISIGVTLP